MAWFCFHLHLLAYTLSMLLCVSQSISGRSVFTLYDHLITELAMDETYLHEMSVAPSCGIKGFT